MKRLLLFLAVTAGLMAAETAWKMDLSSELALWREPGAAVDASAELPVGKKIELGLRPNSELKFLVAPHRAPKSGTYGAMPVLRVDKGGLYRVCAGAPVWLDLVEAKGRSVREDHYEMNRGSPIRKCVVFPLKTGKRYILQVSGSFRPRVGLLITPDNRH